MRKQSKITVVISIFCYLVLIVVVARAVVGCVVDIVFSVIEENSDMNTEVSQHIQGQKDEVELFFYKKGYEIDIIGAYTNGRENGGPFLYGWYWNSFDIGSEVIMLYHYDDMDEINGYLEEMDDKTRNKCYISGHFVFYYYGNDEDIINTIKAFCELS